MTCFLVNDNLFFSKGNLFIGLDTGAPLQQNNGKTELFTVGSCHILESGLIIRSYQPWVRQKKKKSCIKIFGLRLITGHDELNWVGLFWIFLLWVGFLHVA